MARGNEWADHSVTRRQVLATAGAVAAVGSASGHLAGTVGARRPAVQYDCKGASLAEEPEELPTIDLCGEEPTATDVPDDGELLVYVYGYDTPVEFGRRLGATLAAALDEQGYTGELAVAEWNAQPESGAETEQSAGAFAEAEANADADGRKLARWLEANATGRTVRIVGYSLGCRVSLRALDAVDGRTVDIGTVSLLGPAVPARSVCPEGGQFDTDSARAVFSYHSANDGVICGAFAAYLSVVSEQDPPALGCTGSDCPDSRPGNVVDRDVTARIGDHCAYGFPDVGVVPDLVEDFSTPLAANDSQDDAEESAGSDNDGGSNGTDNETASDPTERAGRDDAGPDDGSEAGGEQADEDGAGFGILSALASLGTAGYLAARRWDSE